MDMRLFEYVLEIFEPLTTKVARSLAYIKLDSNPTCTLVFTYNKE
jgi:hypothetical protein